uniref:Kinetochore protein Spc24 n=1 Tax=Peronospora matthiolae TaxID=2874970 RepID=A0AAV1V7G1_9STRA
MSESSGKSLSWPEVQEICGQLEGMFHDDALKDAQRLRVLIQNRKDIASAFHTRQRSAQKLLAHLHANLREWEEKEQMAKKRNEQLHERLQQLDTIKRDVAVQLDRFRLNEQYPFHRSELMVSYSCILHRFCSGLESLDMLMSRYDETKQELLQYHADHQNDIPVAKNQMSLYASVTGIRWDFSDMQMAGDIHVPAKKQIVRFHIDPAMDHFTAANTLWDKIDEAFDDINSDM